MVSEQTRTTEVRDPIMQARLMVLKRVNGYLPDHEFKELEDIIVTEFTYLLGGWKAWVTTTNVDERMYELTHNRQTGETYLNQYKKEGEETVLADDPVHDI